MGTFRVDGLPNGRYTIISNAWIRDARLSFKARGLAVFLASHTKDFRLSTRQIAAMGADGEDSVRSGLQELETAGYLRRVRTRDERTGQLTGTDFFLGDPPCPVAPDQTEKPCPGFSEPGPDQPERDVSAAQPHGGISPGRQANKEEKTRKEDEVPAAAAASDTPEDPSRGTAQQRADAKICVDMTYERYRVTFNEPPPKGPWYVAHRQMALALIIEGKTWWRVQDAMLAQVDNGKRWCTKDETRRMIRIIAES
jgi:hypothetical protein